MAKRRTSRPEKRVLARQQVVRGGRAGSIAIAKAGPAAPASGFGRDILAFLTFVAAVLTLSALLTYRREDALAARVQNLIGPEGHRLASALFGLTGLCAFLFPVALLYTSMALFVRGKGKRRGRQLAGLILLALSGAVLAHLLVGHRTFAYPPGGAVGAALGEPLRALFSTFGAVLLMIGSAGAALIIATDSAFARLCVFIGRSVGHVCAAAWRSSAAALAAGWASLQARRAERARERAEEEAALAQELADAEESFEEELAETVGEAELAGGGEPKPLKRGLPALAEASAAGGEIEAELDAEEADRVAEEAARLAREAEERRARQRAEEQAREAALRAAKRARNAPAEDPAWVTASAPSAGEPAQAPAAEPQKPEEPHERPKPMERPKPILSLPSHPPALAAAPAPAAEAPRAGAVSSPPRPSVPPLAEAAQEPIPAVGPVLPVIVEPKAPPRPSKSEKKDPFAFEGESNFALPPLALLEACENKKAVLDKDVFFATAERLREKLASFGIEGMVKEIRPGPVVTMYEFEPAPGIKISKIASLADDLAMAMEALKVRIVAPIPGKGVVGIEVPNKERETVNFRDVLEQDAFVKSQSRLAMAIGKNIEGMPYITDLAKMPHLLIAGTTGSGKSVSVNAMIMSILFKSTPEEVRMIMVDPKVTELSIYEGIPHLLLPVVTDARKAALALRWAVEEMERRYQLLADAGVRNIAGYNKWVERALAEEAKVAPPATPRPQDEGPAAAGDPKKLTIIDVGEGESEEDAIARAMGEGLTLGVPAPDLDGEEPEAAVEAAAPAAATAAAAGPAPEAEEKPEPPRKLPYIVIIIDEVADLMMVASREVETYVARLAQMARAAGIHLMIATQRPSTDVITGVIKANFPSRISFQLRSKPDSMTILGTIGAEALLGMGDMLILPPTSAHLERVHGAYVSDADIQKVVAHLKKQGKPVYDESILKPREEDGEEGGGSGEEEYNDEMYDQCLALVSEMRQVSVSMLQRKLRLGYNRAARIIERMEREGIVGPANGSKPREVLIRPVGEMHKEVNL
jgi:S-DNA-T family DNA segregation ATPase FtsK/SpoIIIE